MMMDEIDKAVAEGLLSLIVSFAVSFTLISIGGWAILSVITFEAVLISLLAGVSAFVLTVPTYYMYQTARLNKVYADQLEEMNYDVRLEAWKEHINEQQEQEEKERELQLNRRDQP